MAGDGGRLGTSPPSFHEAPSPEGEGEIRQLADGGEVLLTHPANDKSLWMRFPFLPLLGERIEVRGTLAHPTRLSNAKRRL